ncbi:MAG: thioredoxin domain-containing protein [Rhodomicrobium sp.]
MTVTGVRGASSVARMAFVSIAVLALGGCAGGLPDIHSISSLSPFGDTPAPAKPRADQPLNPADLIQPGALDDVAIGKANAPVTIVQYVSLNCATCGGFQREALPKLKKSYIDKGKARLIVREFPEDGASTTAALAVRCVPAKDYLKAMEKLLSHQKDWAGPEAKKDALYNLVKFAGVKRDKFDACLANQSMNEGLVSVKERAKGFGVTVTPTFFVNGKKIAGAVSYEEMKGVVEAALAATQAPAAGAPAQPQPQRPANAKSS